MPSGALSLALDMPPFSDFIIPNALAILDFSANDSIIWDNTVTPSVSSIKYKNNSVLSASCSDKSRQPIADSINGKQAAKFDGGDDFLQFASRLTNIRTVLWVGRLHLSVDHFNDTWLGTTDNVGLYCGAGPTYALLDTAFTPSLWSTNWLLNSTLATPSTTAAPIGSNFTLAMQTTSDGSADYISRDRDFVRGLPIVLGEIQISSSTFTEQELRDFETILKAKWNF